MIDRYDFCSDSHPCWQGSSWMLAVLSKQIVQAFSFTLSLFIASSFIGLGRILRSSSLSWHKSLKDLNSVSGGYLYGLQPKLNSHCWNDMKLAAGKKPELNENLSLKGCSFRFIFTMLYFGRLDWMTEAFARWGRRQGTCCLCQWNIQRCPRLATEGQSPEVHNLHWTTWVVCSRHTPDCSHHPRSHTCKYFQHDILETSR